MDFVDRNAMDRGFGFGYASQDFFAGSKNPFVISCFFDDFQNLPGIPEWHRLLSFMVRMVVFMDVFVFAFMVNVLIMAVPRQDQMGTIDAASFLFVYGQGKTGN